MKIGILRFWIFGAFLFWDDSRFPLDLCNSLSGHPGQQDDGHYQEEKADGEFLVETAKPKNQPKERQKGGEAREGGKTQGRAVDNQEWSQLVRRERETAEVSGAHRHRPCTPMVVLPGGMLGFSTSDQINPIRSGDKVPFF